MGFVDKLLGHVMKGFVTKHRDELVSAMNKVNNGGTLDDIDIIVRDYCYLIQKVHRTSKPETVTLHKNDPYLVSIDGKNYDFDELIHHNDSRGTGCKYELEALLGRGNIPIEIIEKRLKNKIDAEW